MMRYCLMALTTVLVAAQVPAAYAAAPVQLECFITMKATGEHMTHLVTVDLDHHSVKDGSMRFMDGGPSVPLTVDNLRSFVRPDGSRIQWGVEYRATGEPHSLFTIDLKDGAYNYSDADGTNSDGTCKPVQLGT